MSGIAALIRFDGGPIEPGLIQGMIAAQSHRGPDGTACWSGGSVALGHAMLRTTPESLEETQPLANEDESVVLTMDGRIDNWEELGAELRARGARLRTRADAELVLRAYEAWGEDCVHHMDGDFALVVWDARRRAAFCARDRMGHKPFHYHWDGTHLAVASELHAILALPWVEAELNEGMVAEHISDDLFSLEETLWKRVFRLPPAHRTVVFGMGLAPEIYWAPNLALELKYKREEEYVEHHRTILENAVARQSRAREPLACEVSGGLDSSAVFAIAERLRCQAQLMAPALEGYTFLLKGDPRSNDFGYAQALGEHIGRKIHDTQPAFRNLDWYRGWVRRYKDLPPAPNGTTHIGIYEAARAHGSRVILGGFGGDQWFSGDHTYYAGALAKGKFGEFLEHFTRDAGTYGLERSLYLSARFGIIPLLPNRLRQTLRLVSAYTRGERFNNADWMAPSLVEIISNRKNHAISSDMKNINLIHRNRLGILSNSHIVFAQEIMDRLAANYGLEIRSPLNSAAVVQFGFSVPHQWLLRNGWDRYLHRRAMVDYLPSAVAWRQVKGDFTFAFEQHTAGLSDALKKAVSVRSELWADPDRLAEFLNGTESRKVGGLFKLWALFACDAVREVGNVRQRS